jgi:hypothetical protein
MATYYYTLDSKGDYIYGNFPDELKYLVTDFKERHEPFEIIIGNEKKMVRLGFKTNEYGKIYTLTNENKYIKSNNLFKELLFRSTLGLESFSKFHNDLLGERNRQTEEFMHNVTSLNSYSIQDLFTLIPQDVLTENINKQNEIVKAIIIDKPNITVKTLLKLIKYNLSMKVEFSVYDRTLRPNSYIKKISHSLRGIVLSILQIFIDDFEDKHIEVSLDACERRLNVDYDSLFVSLFYIFDNSICYCCPHTKYKIIFKEEENNTFSLLFIMISIKIQKNEVSKIGTRDFRSDLAKQIKKDGHGIGMYRLVKTLQLNDAVLEITPRINDFKRTVNSFEYEANQFKIKFKNQHEWFK